MEEENNTKTTDIKGESTETEKNFYFEIRIDNKENVLFLILEIKNSKLLFKITDTNCIGNGLYMCELSKEDFEKINRFFKSFENINEIFETIKCLLKEKKYNLEFDENFQNIKLNLEAIVFNRNEKIILELKRAEMSDKEIINQLCEKVKLLNLKIEQNQNSSKSNKILDQLKSNIILNEDEYNMISDQIEEKTKKKILKWEKIFSASIDGDTAESFHEKCDGIEKTVILVKTKKYKRFGGFTTNKWNHNNGGFSNDSKAFLFNLITMDIFNRNDNGCEMQGNKAYGPWFGSGPDFQIANKCFTSNSVHNKKCFNYPQNVAYPLAENSNFLVKEYEVYKIEFEPKVK